MALIALAVGFAVGFAVHRLAQRRHAPRAVTPVRLRPYALTEERGPRWSPQALAQARRLIAPLASDAGMPRESAVVVEASDGQMLYQRNASALLVPASTMKLLVGSAAYFGLGSGYRLHTRLVAGAAPDPGGVIHGDLVLVGSGDPLLSSDDLAAAAAALQRRGVRRVEGALVVDASAFAGPEQNPSWLPSDLEYRFAAGASAVTLDEGVVRIDVAPTTPGAPAKIAMEPANGAIRINGGATTTSSTMSLSIERTADGHALDISGGIPAGARQSFWRTVVDQPAFVGNVFARMLRARGISVGGVRVATSPVSAGTLLWDHASQPVGQLVRSMFFDSDNHTAEQLLRVIGREPPLVAGSIPSGLAAERHLFGGAGIDLGATRALDASGLSPRDRIAAGTLAHLLAVDLRARGGAAFVETLPRAGIEGTVRFRSLDEALGRVRAKDGYEDGASSLAGYVQTRHHGTVCFAFVADEWDSLDRVWQLEDDILDRVSTL